jgi:hypothetical protein
LRLKDRLFTEESPVACRREDRRAASSGRLRAALPVFALMYAAGCDTIRQDLSGIAEGFSVKSPGEAARDAVDLNDPDRRREGIVLLGNAVFGGSDPYLALYRDYAANDANPLVRAAAIQALARHGMPEDAPLIASQLTNDNVQVRWEAAKGLERIHNPEVVPDLLQVLRKDQAEDADVRVSAATALGQYPEDRVFQGLLGAMDQRELAVNLAAEASLRTITGRDLGPRPEVWLTWYQSTTEPFSEAGEYMFPTYSRPLTWFERIAFWSPKRWETPAQPAGLRPADQTTTYGEETEEAGGPASRPADG